MGVRFEAAASPRYEVSNFDNFPTTEISFAFWVKNDVGADGDALLGYAEPATGSGNDFLVFGQSDIQFFIDEQSGQASGLAIPDDGRYHFVGIRWRSSDGAWKVYIDDAVSSGTGFRTGVDIETGGTMMPCQEQDTHGGGLDDAQAMPCEGAELALWGTYLSDAEFMAMRNGITPDKIRFNQLAGYWNMRDNSPYQLDLSGHGNHLSMVGILEIASHPPAVKPIIKQNIKKAWHTLLTPIAQVIYPIKRMLGGFSGARNFDGVDNEITLGVTLPYTAAGGLSIGFWVKSSGSHSNLDAIISEGPSSGDITFDYRTNAWKLHVGSKFTPALSNDFTDNVWHYVLCTYLEGSSGHIRAYIDDMETPDADDTSDMGSFVDSSSNFVIGNLSGFSRFFNGNLAGVKVWDVVLNKGQRILAKNNQNVRSDKLLLDLLLDSVTSLELDISGNNNHGTVVGAKPVLGPPQLKSQIIVNRFFAFGDAAPAPILKTITDSLSLSHVVKLTSKLIKITQSITQSSVLKFIKTVLLSDTLSLTHSIKPTKLILLLQNISLSHNTLFTKLVKIIQSITLSQIVNVTTDNLKIITDTLSLSHTVKIPNKIIKLAQSISLSELIKPTKIIMILENLKLIVSNQFGRPISDVSNAAGWFVTPLWEKIDEKIPDDDVSVITLGLFPSASTMEVKLSPMTDPQKSTGHIIRVTHRLVVGFGATVFSVQLIQGTTQIATTPTIFNTTPYSTYEHEITPAEADSITDYSDLRLRVSNGVGGDNLKITQMEFEISLDPVRITKLIKLLESFVLTHATKLTSKVIKIQETLTQTHSVILSKLVKIADTIGLSKLISVIKPIFGGQTIPFGNASAQNTTSFGNAKAQDSLNMGDAKG